jgi:endonuclease/exonuclease/phosphatase (EEP) superfamily protein YafD
MISFLFWNLKGHDGATWEARAPALRRHLARMLTSLGVDVLVLAESAFSPDGLLAALAELGAAGFCYPVSNSRRIQIYTRFPTETVKDAFNDSSDGRLTVRRFTPSPDTDLLLAALHFQSKQYWTGEAQALQAVVLREDIVAVEESVGHQRTILVGDFNMNPFEPGVSAGPALNAVMDRRIARDEERSIARRR